MPGSVIVLLFFSALLLLIKQSDVWVFSAAAICPLPQKGMVYRIAGVLVFLMPDTVLNVLFDRIFIVFIYKAGGLVCAAHT